MLSTLLFAFSLISQSPAALPITNEIPPALRGQPIDEAYTKKILEYTTEPFFLTELVDHMPSHPTVPTPEKVLGYAIGTPNILTYSYDCARYLRELEKTSPRVKVLSMGKSEEGREMVVVLISDEANIARLDRIKQINAMLGDPRKIAVGTPSAPVEEASESSAPRESERSARDLTLGANPKSKTQNLKSPDDVADALIAEGVPIYWATGGMHSTETGPPEMIMELAYRLAVEETPFIQTIRKNSVVMLTPVLEVDGRDRVVDIHRYRQANPGETIPLVYWGKYVAHDNNRDGMVLSLQLSKNIMKTWLDFYPTVFHDLHESVPYLYISTGTGPYNAWLDPITINEWQILAYNEINEMTKRGVPGVWTHDFFDGWAPHYGFYAANGHNAIGRFYETFGGGWADTGIRSVGRQTQRDWFRPNPPFPRVRWSLRNNTNLMQSALLMGMHKVASEKELFLKNYWLKSKRSVAKARTEGPAAYVFSGNDKRVANRRMLLRILQAQGVEVSNLGAEVETGQGKFPAGSLVVRMDQPYSRMADMMLDSQYYKPEDPRSYDDCGWQLGPLFNVMSTRVTDAKILDAPMQIVADLGPDETPLETRESYAVRPNGDVSMVQLRMWNPDAKIRVADAAFQVGTESVPAGTWIVEPGASPLRWPDVPRQPIPGANLPALREVPMPRIAMIHTWTSTQDEGWFRIAFDQLKVPFKYTSVHEIRDTPDLRAKYDVILLAPGGGSAQNVVNGLPTDGDPIAWKASREYPNLGGPDSSDDIRGGIELSGMVHLQRFVKEGGVLICVGNMVRLPIDYGIVSGVSVAETEVNAPGGVYLAEVANRTSPIVQGYDANLGIYTNVNRIPLLTLGGGGGGRGGGGQAASGRASGRGSLTDPDVIQGRPPYTPKAEEGDSQRGGFGQGNANAPRPSVILRFAEANKVLLSGMVDDPAELEGKAALVHCPVGKGSVVLFGMNPMWRCETVGSYMLLFNSAILLPRR